MSESPYINWFTGDFLGGVQDMPFELIGIYAVILNLIADKGAPIDDDPSWIARRAASNARACNRLLNQLAALGKIERRNGLIGNERMLKEVSKRRDKGSKASGAAQERWRRWRAENKPQLDFGEAPKNSTKKTQKPRTSAPLAYADAQTAGNDVSDKNMQLNSETFPNLSPKNLQLNSQLISDISKENNGMTYANASSLGRAPANPELESTQTRPESPLRDSARENSDGLDRDGDILVLLEQVSLAAGYVPTSTTHYADAVHWIGGWHRDGIDFNETVIPAIEAAILKNPDRTSTLKRFDQTVRLAHAQRSAQGKRGPAPPPPETKLDFENEPPEIRAFRADMLKHLGPRLYAQFLNRARLEIAPTLNGSKPLKIIRKPSDPHRLLDGDRVIPTNHFATKHGFTAVWE